jgi:hypothetical protein
VDLTSSAASPAAFFTSSAAALAAFSISDAALFAASDACDPNDSAIYAPHSSRTRNRADFDEQYIMSHKIAQ